MLGASERRRLTDVDPVVMLGRIASATGALSVRILASTPASIALAYSSRGVQGVLAPGLEEHGPDTAHPRVSLTSGTARIDLGHVDELTRFAVVVRDARGTLVATTAFGSQVSVDLESAPTGQIVALTGHVVGGALVLRAELRHVPGSLRDAITAFGFNQVAWASGDQPLPPHHS
ncbi:hypothetical protein [Xylanimonas protaetiae]|uniref:Uncharacterized protein n=1 Tax=Xylanimonas protaetiae TaxID=2509457 RepID=A0A4P6F5S5_9MICO|nr:hypothetical protein [Xylanimonas protaetiae]QAY70735.1 hypothetical protein ET471_12475 [Xylanimonas protaetiae]